MYARAWLIKTCGQWLCGCDVCIFGACLLELEMSLSKDLHKECLIAFKKCNHSEAVRLLSLVKDPRNVCTCVRDTNITWIWYLYNGRVGLLHLAVFNGWLDVMETLIDKYHIEPQKGGYDIYTLHVAVVTKRIDIVKYLITKCHCDPMCNDENGWASLHCAAQYGSLNVMKYLITECNCDPMVTDDYFGSTCLHEAVWDKQYSIIEYLLSTGKVDPLAKNKNKETPLQKAKGDDKMRSLFIKFGKVETSHPVDSYVNVLLLGNPGAGKSTLAQVIIERASITLLAQFRTVKGVELCTAGIIPTKLQHKELGNIILHDFAGQAEYYTSHTAVIENLLQGSAAVFVVLVNILEEEATKQLQQWLTIVTNEVHKALKQCHIIVVVSHVDEMTDTVTKKRRQSELQQIIKERCDTHVSIEYLDCRKLGGSSIGSLLSNLSSACQSIRNTSGRNLSLYCHMMYGLLEESTQNILSLSDIISATQTNENYILPDTGEETTDILSSLHSTGLISLLKSTDDPNKVWVVVNKQILLAEVDGILFAPKSFKQHCDIASNTGIITVSALAELFPCYDPDMLICFLTNMALCQEIHPQFLETITNLIAKGTNNDKERFLFFPTLLNIDRPDNINQQVFQFGWCLQCTEDYHFFPSHFFHVLLLCLAYKFGLPEYTSKLAIVNRQCSFWKNGIHWCDDDGIGTLVELVDGSQCVLVLMSCEEGYERNMVSLQRDVITEVTTVQKESCPSLKLLDFVIDPQDLTYPIDKPIQRTVYNVQDIISCIIRKKVFINNKPHSNKVRSSKRLEQVLPNESIQLTDISQLSVLGGHDLKVY